MTSALFCIAMNSNSRDTYDEFGNYIGPELVSDDEDDDDFDQRDNGQQDYQNVLFLL